MTIIGLYMTIQIHDLIVALQLTGSNRLGPDRPENDRWWHYLGDEFALFIEAEIFTGGRRLNVDLASPAGRYQHDISCKSINRSINFSARLFILVPSNAAQSTPALCCTQIPPLSNCGILSGPYRRHQCYPIGLLIFMSIHYQTQ